MIGWDKYIKKDSKTNTAFFITFFCSFQYSIVNTSDFFLLTCLKFIIKKNSEMLYVNLLNIKKVGAYAFENTSTPFCPPKPKELEIAASIVTFLAVLGTTSKSHSRSLSS